MPSTIKTTPHPHPPTLWEKGAHCFTGEFIIDFGGRDGGNSFKFSIDFVGEGGGIISFLILSKIVGAWCRSFFFCQ